MEEMRRDKDAVRARCKSLYGFIQEAWHVLEPNAKFVPGKHLELLCAILEAITFGRFLAAGLRNRFIANVPPGTMKSLTISVFWQAWVWGPCGQPWTRWLSSSYSLTFVRRDTRKCRDLIASEWFQELWPVELTRTGEESFANVNTGTRDGLPFGSLTSGRADYVIVDDPESLDKAESELNRETAQLRAKESLQSRVNDQEKSVIFVIQQRLHEADVTGTLLALKIGYNLIMLPMRYEAERHFHFPQLGFEDWRTKDGELLWPAKMPESYLKVEAIALGAHGVATQWQQRPTARGGGMFKRGNFSVVKVAPVGSRVEARAWDFAATAPAPGKRPDWTVGMKGFREMRTKRFYIEGMVRFQAGPGVVHETVRNTAAQDGHRVAIVIPRDPSQAGKDQAETYVQELAGYTVIVHPVSKAEGSKPIRAEPAANQVEAGNVSLIATGDPEQDAWIETFLREIEVFPRGQNDDQVDAFADLIVQLSLRSQNWWSDDMI